MSVLGSQVFGQALMKSCEVRVNGNLKHLPKFYSFERRGKLNLIWNFDLSLSSFRVNRPRGGSSNTGVIHKLGHGFPNKSVKALMILTGKSL